MAEQKQDAAQKAVSLISSRRFLLALAGVAAVAFNETLGISEEQVMQVSGIVISWIIGDSVRKTQ